MAVRFNPITGNLDLIDKTAASGTSGEIQYNNGGKLSGTTGLSYNSTSSTVSISLNSAVFNLNTLLKGLAEAESIRVQGSYSIGVPGTVPFGVGPVTSTGMELAPIGPEHYNVIDIRSGSFC